jgi:Domain of unknown function (DUF6438)
MKFSQNPLFFLLFTAIFLQNCTKKAASTPSKTPAATKATPLVKLETGACRGFCPVVILTFNSDGSVDYEGVRSVKKMGKARFQISKKELADLETRLAEANLWQFQEVYPSDIADLPGATLTVYQGKKSKSIAGSAGRPLPVETMQQFLSGLSLVHDYPITSYNPADDFDEKTKGSVIVELKKGVNPGNWIHQFQDIRVKLVRRIAPDRNLWVVDFDQKSIDEESLISLFKSTTDVVNVSKNVEVKSRD